jgi:4-hydroxyphenylpyruvate dioxygenase
MQSLLEPLNPLGMDGIEFVEYATSEPLALGAVLERLGFFLTARHRSREIVVYRLGGMNVIVNADPTAWAEGWRGGERGSRKTALSAIALRVRDAAQAYRHAVDLGAWEIPTRAGAMELNIPGIHGVGDSIIYFVDRHDEFSIYDVDFKAVTVNGLSPAPVLVNALNDLHFFGVVQSIRADRTDEWIAFYQHLMGFTPLPHGQYFGILPKGTLLESPCHKFYIQLVEPPEGADDVQWDEEMRRVGFGTPDVLATTAALQQRGVVFVDREPVQTSNKGALTQSYLGGVTFELVLSSIQKQLKP